jgi:hypothetical protein
MGFKMNCDRCGRFIKNLSMVDLKKQVDIGQEIICSPCQKWEATAKSSIEKEINRMKGDLEKYKKDFVEVIRTICEESRVEE